MKRFFIAIEILFLSVCAAQCKRHTFTCEVDTSKTGYELAGAYDNCTVWNAQKMMAHIERKDIDIRATRLPLLEFGGAYASLNAGENWIQPFYTISEESMSAYPDGPASINGVILAKFKAKDSIDAAFGFSDQESQGICADVQQEIYTTVLYDVLTRQQRIKYRSQGKQLKFIPDDDVAPLDGTTNPVNNGTAWLDLDPATKLTRDPSDPDSYYYEPWSLYVTYGDTSISDEKMRGVRYCKLLSHQAILSWMLEKSFEENPVLIAPTSTECTAPAQLESATNGSCLFYADLYDKNYYCSDYTGIGFTPDSALSKCENSEVYRTAGFPDPVYSAAPCSQRSAEIAAYIPGYQGLTGLCVVHCRKSNEFIMNIYNADPASRCGGFDFFTPGELWQ